MNQFRPWLRSVLISTSCLLGVCFCAIPSSFSQSVASIAIPKRAAITLEPATGWDLQQHAFDAQGDPLPEAPANFRRLGEATAGEAGPLHTLTLRFTEPATLNHIQSAKDFSIERGGSCVEDGEYAANATCTLLVRFTPQGPGHRLGFISIAHSADTSPSKLGLTGYGYAPVVSFTPAQITTVPGTVSSGNGTLSGATSMAIDGGDILYIADTGNNRVKEVDSSGNVITTPLTPIATPASITVDSFGILYTMNVSGSTYYFSIYYPWGTETAYGYTYVYNTCTVSAPCAFSAVGMNAPAHASMDAYDNLFFEEGTTGAAEMPVSGISGGTGTLNLWHLSDQFAYSSGTPASFAVDAGGNLYTSYNFSTTTCFLLQEPLYNAEYSPTANRVAGGINCGFSGDGGQARGAEISSSIGQMAFDIAGDLYFADAGNQRVRRIDAATGIIRTIAGNGTAGYTGDGGKATAARLSNPTGLAVDSQGSVYIISSAATGQVVRKVGPQGFVSFGNQAKASSSAAQFVTVTNTGNNSMVLTSASIGGANASNFKIDNTTTTCLLTPGASLGNGQTCRIGIIFTPSATGARAATLTLLDNTVNGADSVTLTGTGVLGTPNFAITSPANGASFKSGTAVTFSVSVTSASGPQPTGTVQFLVDGANYGSPVTLSSTGTASTSVTGLGVGSHTLSATYNGDTNYAKTGPISVTITVTAAPVVKFTSPLPGQTLAPTKSVTIAVKVSANSGPTPTGKVKFSVDGNVIGSGTLVSGTTSVDAGTLPTGTHTVVAAYSGDKYHPPAKKSEQITVSP